MISIFFEFWLKDKITFSVIYQSLGKWQWFASSCVGKVGQTSKLNGYFTVKKRKNGKKCKI